MTAEEKKKKNGVMKELRFCQELMNRIVGLAEKQDYSYGYMTNHTRLEADIIRLRRELNEIRKGLGEWQS